MTPRLPLHRVDQVRAIDRRAIEDLGIPGYELMTRAAAAAWSRARRRWPQAQRLLVAVGGGNNGGDGYVLARLARESGREVRVLAADDREPGTDDARRARADWLAAGGSVEVFDGAAPQVPDLLVDALLGVGLSAAPREPMAGLIRALDGLRCPRVALDVPSGVDAERGAVPGAVLRADLTVSFIAAKAGLHTGAARDCTGVVEVAMLDVPEAAFVDAPAAWLLRADALVGALPRRAPDSHKGRHGHVLVVGGDHGGGGAVRLAGEAALRAGAGLVSVATREAHVAPLLAGRPELMVHAVDDGPALGVVARRADVLALGPGLGQGAWGRALCDAAIDLAQQRGLALVVDADALNLLAAQARPLPGAVLTPHPGEAARLLGLDGAGAVQADRYGAARAIAGRFDAVVVLKGAGSIVAAPGGELAVIDAGNPGMASAGMGDVLTGVVAALLGQGLAPFEAASIGALAHAAAGDRAAAGGERGLLASDLIGELRGQLNRLG